MKAGESRTEQEAEALPRVAADQSTVVLNTKRVDEVSEIAR